MFRATDGVAAYDGSGGGGPVKRVRTVLLAACVTALALLPAPDSAEREEAPCDTKGHQDCSLREAVGSADGRSGPVRIELAAGTTILDSPEPIVVNGQVELVGTGVTTTVIDANALSRVFHLNEGSVLRLRDLSLVGGRRLPGDEPSAGTVEMVNVLTAGGPANYRPSYEEAMTDYLRSCLIGDLPGSQFYRLAVITDPTALADVPGAVY